jgi:hypothetical protein
MMRLRRALMTKTPIRPVVTTPNGARSSPTMIAKPSSAPSTCSKTGCKPLRPGSRD